VPERELVTFVLEALEMMDRDPDELPADAGLKVTLKEMLCSGVNVRGKLRPVMLNPLPLALA
jgi:hypothetical protein